eukprot:CAMPEP_0196809408 /NCGR_PEP_ID=MMETSP1362-20130617/9348_1 /TAXON_ID=163516 /ORGANISM="Leptocylindrus danicus, Strain CCMP1856" /LENGTH=62 /DNA_ID=CAMNT_0042184095 /DNA_START=286 /DNA_END=474 /DNA_ORIENTATION=+
MHHQHPHGIQLDGSSSCRMCMTRHHRQRPTMLHNEQSMPNACFLFCSIHTLEVLSNACVTHG